MTDSGKLEDSKIVRKRKAPRYISLYDPQWYFPDTTPVFNGDDGDVQMLIPGFHTADWFLKAQGNFDQPVKKGDPFDAIELLFPAKDDYLIRGNVYDDEEKRVYAQDLERKRYVIILCFYIPVMKDDSVASICYGLLDILSELAKEQDDFQVVLVVRLRPDYPNRHLTEVAEDAFNHFFTAFSSRKFLSCFAVPITDCPRSLKLFEKSGSLWYRLPGCIVADLKKKQVLVTSILDFHLFGADLYPFTKSEELWDQIRNKLCGKMTLAAFLQCQSTDTDTLTCVRPNCRCGVKESLSSLKNKVVLLYFLCDGDFMDKLRELYTHHKGKEDFKLIVVRAQSYLVTEPSKSSALDRHFDSLLENRDCCGWLHRSFDERVSRRLSKLCRFQYLDKLVVVGPDTSYVDPDARLVVDEYGINHYPFTKQTLLENEVKRLRDLTFQEWFKGCGIDKLTNIDGVTLSVSDLGHDKYVVVYFDSVFLGRDEEYCNLDDELSNWFGNMRPISKEMFDMIFLPYEEDDEGEEEGGRVFDLGPQTSWFLFPESDKNGVNNNTLVDSLFGKLFLWVPSLAIFGPDGHLFRLGCLKSSEDEEDPKTYIFPDEAALREDVGILLNGQPRCGVDDDIEW